MKHYFAYGTLLDLAEMQAFAPSAHPNGIMRLDGYEPGFAETCRKGKGGCWLVRKEGAVTYGVDYAMSDEDMEKMDIASGVPDGLWVHKEVLVTDAKGNPVRTVTYTIPDEPEPFRPTDTYVGHILKGLSELDLPADYVERYKAIIAEARARE